MKGKYTISITSRKVNYRLEIERKISVIKGNSGTGKSSIIRLISDYLEYGKQSGIRLSIDPSASFLVLTNGTDWDKVLSSVHDTVLFIDEDVSYIYGENFQRALWEADCYAVIISRSGMFTALPYSILAIYELITEKKGLNTATTMYKLYEKEQGNDSFNTVLTEDSNSGFEMMKYAFESENTKVISAGGNSSVHGMLIKMNPTEGLICVYVDGAAFGAFIEPVLKYAELRGNIIVSAPESFEYVLLNISDVGKHLSRDHAELIRTYEYCDSRENGSWEQYYEKLLRHITSEYLGFVYSKSKLNSWFLNRKCAEQFVSILQQSFVVRQHNDGNME